MPPMSRPSTSESPSRTNPDTPERTSTKRIAEHVLDILPQILDIAADISGNFGVPGLQTGISGLSKVLKKVKATSANIDGIDELEKNISDLVDVLKEFRGKTVPEPINRRIGALSSEWEDIGERARKTKSRNLVKRFLGSSMDAEKLSGLVKEFNASLQKFQLKGALRVEVVVDETQADVRHVRGQVEHIRGQNDDVRVQLSMLSDQTKAQDNEKYLPKYAKNAQYDANDVRIPCLEGTRVEILGMIGGWIDKHVSGLALLPEEEGSIYWANGLAGAGKTTIAFSVAKDCFKKGRLAGSFFCSRFDAECSDPKLIFPSISYQLCCKYPAFKEKVVEALKQDPTIIDASVSRQLEELIVRPLEALKGNFPTLVVVIDALDECRDENARSIVLNALAKLIERLAPLLFVITSRPEPRITALFKASRERSLADVSTRLLLHEVQLPSILEDIKRLLNHGFDEIRRLFDIEEDWPSTKDFNRLADLADGLFIFARTALAFIEDERFRDPEGQLQSLLSRQRSPQNVESPMDALYLQILGESCKDLSEPLTDKLQTILGAITLAQEPLSTAGFAGLLGLSERTIRTTLSGLRSVLYIPDDNSQLIRVIHPTFPEFLTREPPPKGAAFHIQAAEGHAALLSRCFDILENLQRNPLNLENPTVFKREIPDLLAKVTERIPSHLSYACRHWAAHLQGSLGDTNVDILFDKVKCFLDNCLLYWLEACSWLDALVSAVNNIDAACHFFASSARLREFTPLLVDCRRFLMTYSTCIDIAPLRVYYSALSLAPCRSLVVQAYAKEVQHPLRICLGGLLDWSSCLATVSGVDRPTDGWKSVAFSPDGLPRFVTGSNSGVISVWNSTNCAKTWSIDGHRDKNNIVSSITYSPDAKFILSGSGDRTARIWDAESGAHVRTLEGHTDGVWSVSYSGDGTRILSATGEGELKVWDASDGRHLHTFTTDTGEMSIEQVSIFPDGSLIAYATGSLVRLLNISTGERVDVGPLEYARSALVSPDGVSVAGASWWAIHIWTVVEQTLRRIIDVPQEFSCMSFSHESTQIGCGCDDGSVRVWQVTTGNLQRVFNGHVGWVRDIAWSPNGSRIISAGDDGTVRIWDTSHGPVPAGLLEPPPPPAPSCPHTPKFVVMANQHTTTLCALPPAASEGRSRGAIDLCADGAPRLTLCSTEVEAWDVGIQSTYLKPHVGSHYYDFQEKCRVNHARQFLLGRRMSTQVTSFPMPPALSLDGSLIAYTPETSLEDIQIYNLRNDAVVSTFARKRAQAGVIEIATFSPDGKCLATGSNNGGVTIWDVASGEFIVVCAEEKGHWVNSCTFSSDSRLLAYGRHFGGEASAGHAVCVFDLGTGLTLQTFYYDFYLHPEVIFIQDDKAIIILGVDHKTVAYFDIWNIATGARIHRHTPDENASLFHSVNFCSDDTGIVGSNNDVIHLWQPGERTWPVYAINNDGWVYAKRPGHTRRLCWLPMEWRLILPGEGDTLCVYDSSTLKLVELDMSQLLEVAEGWS